MPDDYDPPVPKLPEYPDANIKALGSTASTAMDAVKARHEQLTGRKLEWRLNEASGMWQLHDAPTEETITMPGGRKFKRPT